MSWEKEIEELRRREALARRMGGPEKVKRQHDGGKLTVRERVDRLLDAGSFHEVGGLAGWPVAVMAGNSMYYGGAWTARASEKITRFVDLAQVFHLPVVHLVDCPGFFSLPIAGGLEAAYRAEIEAAADPAARRAQIEARIRKFASPMRGAERFDIEEIIDPRDTRRILCEFAELAAPLRTPGRSHFGVRP